jgi:hypothetical protein
MKPLQSYYKTVFTTEPETDFHLVVFYIAVCMIGNLGVMTYGRSAEDYVRISLFKREITLGWGERPLSRQSPNVVNRPNRID